MAFFSLAQFPGKRFFSHAVKWQNLLDIIYSVEKEACSICGLSAGGVFVNVDFDVLGHPGNKRKGIPSKTGGTNTAINFFTSLCYLSVSI